MAHESFEDPAGRRGHERALRQHQGRPGGAAGRRPCLHERAASAGRAGRLAAHHVPDAGGRAVLGRHLFPEGAALRPAGLRRRCCARSAASTAPSPSGSSRTGTRSSSTSPKSGSRATAARSASTISTASRLAARRSIDTEHGGLQGAPKFPNPPILEFLICYARRSGRRGGEARAFYLTPGAHGARRHPRSSRRRLRALFGRRALARAAFREDALRQRAAAGAPTRWPMPRRAAPSSGMRARGDRRLAASGR